MVNYYDRKRFISKSTLARLADVSPRTFRRYLATRREILSIFGVTPKTQKLPPYAVRYICEDYCIDLPPELQDKQTLSASPLRDIIIKSWEEELKVKKSQNEKKHRYCRTKWDDDLPECSTFALSKGPKGAERRYLR